MKSCLGIFAAGVLAATAHASNFSYTYVELGIGKTTLDEEIVFAGEYYDEFAAATASGSYQFDENIALRLSSSAIANDGPSTEITEASASIAAVMPFAIGNRVDIAPMLGFASMTAEFCYEEYRGWYRRDYYSCTEYDDTGAVYGLTGRFWAVPGRFELNAAVTASSIDNTETTTALGGAFWFNSHHSIRANLGVNDVSSTFTAGYAYTW